MEQSGPQLYQEELKRCRKLYHGFKEIEPFLEEIISEVLSFFNEHEAKEEMLEKDIVDKKKAHSHWRKGRSLAIRPRIRTHSFLELLQRLGEALIRVNPRLEPAMEELKNLLEDFRENNPEKVDRDQVFKLQDLMVEKGVLEKDMATLLFSVALGSIFSCNLEKIREGLRTDLWEGGNCGLCGEKPHYGMLRSEDGAKVLECWLCGTRWVHTRIKCPFCANTQQEELGFFSLEDKSSCRVHFCRECSSYYKIIDARQIAGNRIVLPIHNLASLTHDVLAREEGFSPGSGLHWVPEGEEVN